MEYAKNSQARAFEVIIMFHRIRNITPLKDKILLAEFQDGTIKHYDVKNLKDKIPVFEMLDYIYGLFEQVHVDAGGLGIVLNNDLDLDADEIYYNGY